uniref:Uncharacterized protein n=1 Tax=Meloidogyne enterolobii TaxID=390850 RepID=A0A6V7XFJ2_MELEN|nr:unnamed protein product [Meloidogyne enterolobii]
MFKIFKLVGMGERLTLLSKATWLIYKKDLDLNTIINSLCLSQYLLNKL